MFCAKVSSKTPANFFPDLYVIRVYIKTILNVFITNLFFCWYDSKNLQYLRIVLLVRYLRKFPIKFSKIIENRSDTDQVSKT